MITGDHTATAREIVRKLKTREDAVEVAWGEGGKMTGDPP